MSAPDRLPLAGDLLSPVNRLVTRAALFVDAVATVGEAARRMSEHRVSSLLVRGDPAGIVTDRDLRSRVLAEGRGPETPVREVMSTGLKTLSARATVFEALIVMLEEKIHHLPLVEGGDIVALVSDTDLLRQHLKSPLHLLGRIEKLDEPSAFASYVDELAAMVRMLFEGGLEVSRIGLIVSSLHDAAAVRLLRLAERELGAPPVPYAWIVHGSEGRQEQMLLTDQDNALVFDNGGKEAEPYFSALAERVVEGLVALGVPRCAGGFMATRWRRSLADWEKTFADWMRTPDPQALLEAANLFDFRKVHGQLEVKALDEVIAQAAQRPRFLAQMAGMTCGLRPPLGLFRRLREGKRGVDLKLGGILPIVSLARTQALASGVRQRGTLDRLEAASASGAVSSEGAAELAEAYRFLQGLRLRRQLESRRTDAATHDHVRVAELRPGERRRLKQAFRLIREMQEDLALRYQTNLLG